MDFENSLLIKCLECRLIRPPPKFDLGPPPPLPADLLTADFLHSLNVAENRELARQLKNIKLKKCLPVSRAAFASPASMSLDSVIVAQQPLTLSHEQSLAVFVISFALFLAVFAIAVFFTVKLVKIRRQLREFKSLNKSGTTTATATTSSGLMSKSNTITSAELILTPASDSGAFYNQLFETTKQLSSSSSSSASTTSSNASNSPKQQPYHVQRAYEHYLQAVPSNSARSIMLFGTGSNSSASPAGEYDEISSQAYLSCAGSHIFQPVWYPSAFQYQQQPHLHQQHQQMLPASMMLYLKPSAAMNNANSSSNTTNNNASCMFTMSSSGEVIVC